LFKVPPYPLEKLYGEGPYPHEIRVSIYFKVDQRDSERATSFAYFRKLSEISYNYWFRFMIVSHQLTHGSFDITGYLNFDFKRVS